MAEWQMLCAEALNGFAIMLALEPGLFPGFWRKPESSCSMNERRRNLWPNGYTPAWTIPGNGKQSQ